MFYDEPCNLDIPGCEPDEYAYDGPPEEQCPNDGKDELRRDSSYMTDLLFDDVSHEGGFSLEARAGGPRTVLIEGLWKAALRTYPSIGTLFQPRRNVQGPSEYIFRYLHMYHAYRNLRASFFHLGLTSNQNGQRVQPGRCHSAPHRARIAYRFTHRA